jgi:hypothetical protein
VNTSTLATQNTQCKHTDVVALLTPSPGHTAGECAVLAKTMRTVADHAEAQRAGAAVSDAQGGVAPEEDRVDAVRRLLSLLHVRQDVGCREVMQLLGVLAVIKVGQETVEQILASLVKRPVFAPKIRQPTAPISLRL